MGLQESGMTDCEHILSFLFVHGFQILGYNQLWIENIWEKIPESSQMQSLKFAAVITICIVSVLFSRGNLKYWEDVCRLCGNTMPFSKRDLNVCGFWYLVGSWN